MNESLVKYLAGLLDADGSLSFAFKSDQNRVGREFVGLCLSLASSDAIDLHGFIETLPTLTGMGAVYRYGAKQQFKAWKISKRSDLEMILPRLTKHMVIKARHWDWMLAQWRDYRRTSCSVADAEKLKAASKLSRIARVGPLKAKSHPTWAWTAGYLDGDGWYRYSFEKSQNYWQMHVGAVAHKNDASVLEFLTKAFGGNTFEHGQSPDVFTWRRSVGVMDRSFALKFLPNLAKHSRLKRHKIDQMIHHHRQRLSDQSAEAQATV